MILQLRRYLRGPAFFAFGWICGPLAGAAFGNGQPVLTIGDEKITVEQVRAEYAALPPTTIQRARTDDFAARNLALDWYHKILFAKGAEDAGIPARDEGVQRAAQGLARQILAAAYLRDQEASRFAPSEPEMRQLFAMEPSLCASSERMRFARLGAMTAKNASEEEKVAARKRFDAMVARLEAGDSFADVANQDSDFSGSGTGGDMGWIPTESIRKTANGDELAPLAVGARSEVIETSRGWLIYEVLAREAAGELSYESCRGRLDETIRRRYQRDLRKRAVNELAERYESFLDIDAFVAAIRSVPLPDDPRAATAP